MNENPFFDHCTDKEVVVYSAAVELLVDSIKLWLLLLLHFNNNLRCIEIIYWEIKESIKCWTVCVLGCVFHCLLPLCHAVYPACQRSDFRWCSQWHHILPETRSVSSWRCTGKMLSTHIDLNSYCIVLMIWHFILNLLVLFKIGLDRCWNTNIFFICHWIGSNGCLGKLQ